MALDRLGSNAIADLAVSAADIAAGTITTAQIANDAVTTAKIADSVNLGRRNIIINGAMNIAQRSTSAVAASNGYNTVDRWKHFKNGAGAFTTQRVADHPMGHGYSLKCQVTTADTSIAATDYAFTETNLEGQDCSSFLYGTSNAKDLTISFWCKSNKTGIYCVSLYKHAGGGTAYMYRKEYTITAANTWEKKTITVSPTAGSTSLITASPAAIVNDNGAGMQLVFGFTWGSNFHGTDNTWQTGSGYGTSSQVNWLDNTANNFYLTEVQLEVGDTATPFEHLPIAQQMELCQRYYYKENYNTRGPHATQYENGHKFAHLFHPTTMRAIPTSTVAYDGGTQTEYQSTTRHFKSYISSAYDSTSQHYLTSYQADAEL